MALNKLEFEKLLIAMKFKLQNGPQKIYSKTYKMYNNYVINVDFDNEFIEYETRKDDAIIVSNKFSSNFSQSENMVVLECVNRLLSLGYKPSTIELEHSWPSGHGTSGRLDIMVKKDNKSYLMIDCKTYGKEFEKEKQNTLQIKKVGKDEQPKGQLFAYCWEEKSTEYLCLYASCLKDEKIIYENAIIQVDANWKNLSNKKEMFDYWNKNFKENGIFEDGVTPYNIKCRAKLRCELSKITNEDSSRIFNQFLEILRHNAVSDKPNAFNKILNLFICKIIDEEKADNEELQFQWKDDSTYISLQSNLEELYKQGMDRFLNIEVTDYSDSEIDRSLALMDEASRALIKKMFQELRLQKNPEFAFKEVFNQESFEENAKVLKEVVELLQPYQFRYGHKQQFLGNFFEQLLNTSIKQESGQFFTPVPIARFMISSLPIKKILDKNISINSKNILPIAIDYACGSGHFLTEYMDILQEVINYYDTSRLGKNLKNKIEKWKQSDNEEENQGEFEWAKDCVYGIEKDYRLAKTTKISTFLNGDGEANIIHADGLDRFDSVKYTGLLNCKTKDNNNFDFLIANPPYSVSSFKQTLNVDSSDFELYSLLTENSSEIECLFLERTKQLLKNGGCAAIILPSSILSNTGLIYEKTRDILFKNFYIRAIAKMSSNTFMATGTNTVIMFLEKRSELHVSQIEKIIDNFFETKLDFNYCSYQNIISMYVKYCCHGMDYSDYISFLNNEPTERVKNTDKYTSIISIFNSSIELKNLKKTGEYKSRKTDDQKVLEKFLLKDIIKLREKQRLIYFLLTFSNQTLLLKTGAKQEEKDFLGYEFSNRRGYEGIHYYKNEDGTINSSLYDDSALFENIEKANYYILKSFDNIRLEIPEELASNIRYVNSSDLLTFDSGIFNNTISLSKKEKIIYNCESSPLAKVCEIKIGGTPPRSNRSYFTGENLWVSISEMDGQIIYDTKEKLTDDGVKISNVKLIKAGTTLLSFKLSIGKVAVAGNDLYTNEAIAGLEIRDEYIGKITNEYLFYLFKSKIVDIEGSTKAFGESLNSTTLGELIIPIPSIDEQNKFIKECQQSFKEIEEMKNLLKEKQANKKAEIEKYLSQDFPLVQLGDEEYLSLKRGPFGGDLKKEIFVSKGYKVYEQKHAIQNNFKLGKYYVTKAKYDSMSSFHVCPNDIIMSCSGTIGKLAMAPNDIEPGVINQALLRFRTTDKIIPKYLLICLEEITDNFSKHGLGLQNLSSVDSLKPIKIPVPTNKEEQIKIVKIVEKYNFEIEKIKSDISNKAIEQKELIKKYV